MDPRNYLAMDAHDRAIIDAMDRRYDGLAPMPGDRALVAEYVARAGRVTA